MTVDELPDGSSDLDGRRYEKGRLCFKFIISLCGFDLFDEFSRYILIYFNSIVFVSKGR